MVAGDPDLAVGFHGTNQMKTSFLARLQQLLVYDKVKVHHP
jgi:hypothetical protein